MSGNQEQKTKFQPSKLIATALGDHAAEQDLQQAETESEIDFAVRCIEALGDHAAEQDLQQAETESEIDFAVRCIEALGDHAAKQDLQQAETESEVDFAVRCIEALGGLVTTMDGSIQSLEAERDSLTRSLAAQKGATTRKANQIEEMEEAARPRPLGPIKGNAATLLAADLSELVDGAEEIVLAFSDGKKELRGISPRRVSCDAFKLTRGLLRFIGGPLTIEGPGGDGAAPKLAGVALLIDGDQVGWSPMGQPLALGAGQSFDVSTSVVFG